MTCRECEAPVKATGLCAMHYAQSWAARNPERMAAYRKRCQRECEACQRPCRGKRWCRDCAPLYQSQRKSGVRWQWLPQGSQYSRTYGELSLTAYQRLYAYVWLAHRNGLLVASGTCKTLTSAKRAAERVGKRAEEKKR